MSSLSTLPKGDSAWLLRKSIQRIMQQVSVLETNIGSSTTGNSSDTQIIFNDAGTLRGDSGLTYNKTTDLLSVGAATITGDLTVDTNVLKVDTTLNRVGINNASPTNPLNVTLGTHGSAFNVAFDASGNTRTGLFAWTTGSSSGAISGGAEYTGSSVWTARSTAASFVHMTSGEFQFFGNTGLTAGNTYAPSELMRLNSTGLGVGVSPSYKLDVAGSSAGVLRLVNINNLSTDPAAVTRLSLDGQGATWHLDNERTNGIFKITRNSTACLTIDNSGNVGIGVTPSAWGSFYKAIESSGGASYVIAAANINGVNIASNCFNNNTNWIYKETGAVARFSTNNNIFQWFQAASGTAGTAITFTQAMTLDASGNLDLAVGNLKVSNGKGIDFSATPSGSGTMTSELLSDYEEGTWTGTLTGATTNPTTPVTATGRYTKIGRQVSIQIQFTNVDTTGASGQIKVTGAPFTNNSSVSSTGSVLLSSIGTFTGSPAAFIGVSTTEIELYSSSSAGAIGFVTHNAGASRSLYINLTYTV